MKKQSWVVYTKRVWVFYTQINRGPRHRVALSNTVVFSAFFVLWAIRRFSAREYNCRPGGGLAATGTQTLSASDALGSQEFVQAALIAIQGLQESVQGPASAVGSLYRAK